MDWERGMERACGHMASGRWCFPEPPPDLGNHNDPAEGQEPLKAVRLKEFNKVITNQEQHLCKSYYSLKNEPQSKQRKKMKTYGFGTQCNKTVSFFFLKNKFKLKNCILRVNQYNHLFL